MTAHDKQSPFSVRHFIDDALKRTGLTMEQLSERMDYRSLVRVRNGEFPLPEAKRKHIEDLIRLAELEQEHTQVSRVAETPEVVPAFAAMDDDTLAEAISEMMRTFAEVPARFRASARADIGAAFGEWIRRTDEAARQPVIYAVPSGTKKTRS